jgi:hypothetical protein
MNRTKLRQSDVTATRLFPSGAWECTAMFDTRLHRHVYYDTKRAAVRAFVDYVNSRKEDPPGR